MDGGSDRVAGAALVLAAALAVLMMAHHPTSAHAAGATRFVHGAMIALVGAMGFAFAHWARRAGLGRPVVLAGLIAFGIGAAADIGAATINGFVVPALVERGPIDRGVAAFAWEANQALAGLGVAAWGAAFVLWSLRLFRLPGWKVRGLALSGVLAGVVPPALLFSGALSMNLAGAMLVYALQSLWIALAGLHLWSGRFARDALNASRGM